MKFLALLFSLIIFFILILAHKFGFFMADMSLIKSLYVTNKLPHLILRAAFIPFLLLLVFTILDIVKNKKTIFSIFILLAVATTTYEFVDIFKSYKLNEFFYDYSKKSDFFKNNYIPYESTKHSIGKKRNIIVISIESMEETLSHPEFFGTNIIPHLSEISENNISFSGYVDGYAQNWTQASLVALHAGLPLNVNSLGFKMDNVNHVSEKLKKFLPNVKTLTDILSENGYNLLYMQPGNIKFSNADLFLLSHGYKKEEIYGEDELAKEGVAYSYNHNWWGQPDAATLEVFKRKLLELSKRGNFFAFYSSIDTHPGDYPYGDLENKFHAPLLNQYYHASSLIANFVDWAKKQDFYQNTTIVLIGDHSRCSSFSKSESHPIPEKDRRVYNAFINVPFSMQKNIRKNRTFNQVDLFPSILELAGWEIENHRVGIGVSIFSDTMTLAEEYGGDYLREELRKFSKENFELWR